MPEDDLGVVGSQQPAPAVQQLDVQEPLSVGSDEPSASDVPAFEAPETDVPELESAPAAEPGEGAGSGSQGEEQAEPDTGGS